MWLQVSCFIQVWTNRPVIWHRPRRPRWCHCITQGFSASVAISKQKKGRRLAQGLEASIWTVPDIWTFTINHLYQDKVEQCHYRCEEAMWSSGLTFPWFLKNSLWVGRLQPTQKWKWGALSSNSKESHNWFLNTWFLYKGKSVNLKISWTRWEKSTVKNFLRSCQKLNLTLKITPLPTVSTVSGVLGSP